MAGATRILRQYYPFDNRSEQFGPFAEVDTLDAGSSVSASSSVGNRGQNRVLLFLDKAAYVDQVSLGVEVPSGVDATMRIGYATPAQSFEDAIIAEQWLTDAMDLRAQSTGDLVADSIVASDDGTNNSRFNMAAASVRLEAGSRVFANFERTASGLAGLVGRLRVRETVE